jgi:hypothetical protein
LTPPDRAWLASLLHRLPRPSLHAAAVLVSIGPAFPGVDSLVLFLALIAAAWFLGDIVRRWQTLAREHSCLVGFRGSGCR